MATVAEKRKTIRWEEYLSLPLTHYEIIDGEVKELPSPSVRHQLTLGTLHQHLFEQVVKTGLGIVLMAPLDILLSRTPLHTRQPDLLFISKERGGTAQEIAALDRLETTPDLVIEILSPSDTVTEWRGKLQDYARLGVRELWAVDPQDSSIEVLMNENGQWLSHGIFTGEMSIGSVVLPDLKLTAQQVFTLPG
jgi:Uma2 family endonuclease